jgi:mannose-6-phosphate isomerase-like protein (cupin superfamily)
LVWRYGFATQPGEADLSDRIAFAELIGPEASLFSPACRIGFTLMAPYTFYPLHAHPAVELYCVILGEAEWQTPKSARILPAGATVLHPSNLPHAMRSFREPMLALYGWRGDIDTPPHYL